MAGYSGIFNDKLSVYAIVQDNNLHNLLLNTDINWETKMISLMYYLFPHVREYITSNHSIIKDEDYIPSSLPPAIGSTDQIRMQKSDECLILYMIYSIAYAFSTADKIVAQIASGLKTICAKLGTAAPGKIKVKAVYDRVKWSTKNNSDHVIRVLGQVICINADIKYNSEILSADLFTTDDYQVIFQVDNLNILLLEQIRLAYERFRSASIRYARFVYKSATPHFNVAGIGWSTEVTNYAAIANTIGDALYIGLVPTTEYKYRIKTYPKLVYLGILFYQGLLPNDAAKIEFGIKVNIAKLATHIRNTGDKATVETIALFLIMKSSVKELNDIVSNSSLEEANEVLRDQDQVTKEVLYDLLSKETPLCAWAAEQHRIKKDAAIVKYAKEARPVYDRKLKFHEDSLKRTLQYATTSQEKEKAYRNMAEVMESIKKMRLNNIAKK